MNIINKIPIKKLLKKNDEEITDEANGNYININTVLNKKKHSANMSTFKLVIILFLLYIFISSILFKNSVLSLFGKKCINNGNPTCLGVIIQGIFLILFYMLFANLINRGVI
jgi:uncharacterized membrane protein (DUF485 family)